MSLPHQRKRRQRQPKALRYDQHSMRESLPAVCPTTPVVHSINSNKAVSVMPSPQQSQQPGKESGNGSPTRLEPKPANSPPNGGNGQQQQQTRSKATMATTGQQGITEQQQPPQQQARSQKAPSIMADTSILAPSYVPKHLRQIFCMPVGSYLPATNPAVEPLIVLAQRIFFNLVAPVPTCVCSVAAASPPTTPTTPPHILPWLLVPKLSPMEPGFVYSPAAQQRRDPAFVKTFPSIYQLSGRDAYIQFFERLIREEYEETMMLYDRYTQYNQKVTPVEQQKQPPTSSSLSQGTTPNQQTQETTTSQNTTIQRAILSIPGICDARPALQTGDKVLLRYMMSPYSTVEIQADVVRTLRSNNASRQQDQVVISWYDKDSILSGSHPINKIDFAVRFLPSIKTPERCLTALKWLSTIHPSIAKNLLFPSKPIVMPGNGNGDNLYKNDIDSSLLLVDATNPQNVMNEQQSKFCRMVLKRTTHPSYDNVRPPMILTGPAGTGKTKALLMSILHTLSMDETNHRVLVCTPSHTAADVVARRLLQHLPPSSIFRLCDATRPVETAPVDILPLMRQSSNGDFTLPATAKELLSFRVIVTTCVDAHILYLCGMTNASLRSRRQCLSAFVQNSFQNSPGMTLNGTIEGANAPHFTHLFIDEAAQATEPETLIPFSVVVDDAPNVQKVEIALTGDPRQLHPETNSPWAREGLQLALLERLLQQGGRDHMLGPPTKDSWVTMDELIEYSLQTKTSQAAADDHLSVFLTLSYRGHPSFLKVPSKLFYFDKLRSVHTNSNNVAAILDNNTKNGHDWCQVLRKVEDLAVCTNPNSTNKTMEWPIHFRGVLGKDTSIAGVDACWGSNSWANPQEANAIVEITKHMVTHAHVPTQSIGIMAAFRAQVVLIRRLLRQKQLGAVNVGMVEDYQAVERPVILLSLTRSNPRFVPTDVQGNTGLYQQPKRMNVALTRAEHLLIVVGNPNTMEQDPYWKEWLQFCHSHGLSYKSKTATTGTTNQNDNCGNMGEVNKEATAATTS